jgi:hypothetical protein
MTAALANQPVINFTPPNYALFPAAHYVTSPGLVADDVRNHNTVYVPPPVVSNPPPAAPTKPTTATTAPPATTPTTKPGNSPPPRRHG